MLTSTARFDLIEEVQRFTIHGIGTHAPPLKTIVQLNLKGKYFMAMNIFFRLEILNIICIYTFPNTLFCPLNLRWGNKNED